MLFPLPGISLPISFYMLLSVITAVLIANLQIPVSFLQVLLSILRLGSLPGHHHDYRPLPDGASPNLVPSIVVFFMLELCQGLSYIFAVILGFFSFLCRRSLVLRDLNFEEEWGAKALNLYQRQAYQARTQMGLFPSDHKSTPSLTSFAIQCLGSTSSETQNVGLRILDTFLQRWDSKSKTELIEEITSTSKKAVPTLIDMLCSTAAQDKDIRLFAASVLAELTDSIKISEFPGMAKLISSFLDAKNWRGYSLPPTYDSLKISEFPGVVKMIPSLLVLGANNQQYILSENNGDDVDSRRQSIWITDISSTLLWRMLFPLLGMSILQSLACDPDNCAEMVEHATYITTKTVGVLSCLTGDENCGDPEQKEVLRPTLNFMRWFTSNSGKIGARFRQELSSEHTFLLLNSLERILDLEDCQPELWEPVMDIIAKLALDEATGQEIGSTQAIIDKLMRTFLRQDDRSLRMAAGEALANLTIMSTDNCWAILLADPEHNLIKNLNNMLDDEYYTCVAANILHNLCANSRDKLMDIDLAANVHLNSVLQKVMQIMRTKDGKQLEAALCVAPQIGYVIPEYFSQMLESDTDAAAAELVEKLVNTLQSNRKPSPQYPRIRRVLIEVLISISSSAGARYIKIFKEKGAKDALDIVKGAPSRLEKYRVFLNGKGVVAESSPMRDLVDKAKKLIDPGTPSPGSQPVNHA